MVKLTHYIILGRALVHIAPCGKYKIAVADLGSCNFWRLCEFLGRNPFIGGFDYCAQAELRKAHPRYKALGEMLEARAAL